MYLGSLLGLRRTSSSSAAGDGDSGSRSGPPRLSRSGTNGVPDGGAAASLSSAQSLLPSPPPSPPSSKPPQLAPSSSSSSIPIVVPPRKHRSSTSDSLSDSSRNNMNTARNIDSPFAGLSSEFQNSLGLSVSPTSTFHSPSSPFGARNAPGVASKQLKPFNTGDVRILLLENVNQTAQDILTRQGYQVEFHKSSLPEDELIEKIRDVHAIGIRSKTKLTARVLREAKNLITIGCFCIGTNQVDLDYAAKHGITVFNSPFSNSRSVAELVIGEIIALARQLCDRSMEMHKGSWNKVSSRCWEIRGKTLGIVGYGHIGSQLSVLAESMGMKVVYYDIVPLMALGTSTQVNSLPELLRVSDFVTLHVPEIAETKNMIGEEQLAHMKQGSYLINASRGSVVDIQALINAMRSGRIAGAALDVYPNEPAANGDYFNATLNTWGDDIRTLKNLIMTPHIGGSTEEAQRAIGVEVADALVRYINFGSTQGAVNMPEVTLRSLTQEEENHVRVIFIHNNRPGVLRQVNSIFGEHNVNKQMSDSRGDVAYLMADISDVNQGDIKGLYESLESLSAKIMTRVLY